MAIQVFFISTLQDKQKFIRLVGDFCKRLKQQNILPPVLSNWEFNFFDSTFPEHAKKLNFSITFNGVKAYTDSVHYLVRAFRTFCVQFGFGALMPIGCDHTPEDRDEIFDCETTEITDGLTDADFYAEWLKKEALEGEPIPANMLCTVGLDIMTVPVYLRTNPNMKYDFHAVRSWILKSTASTDSTPRTAITILDIIFDTELADEIDSFVNDKIERKILAFYKLKDASKESLQHGLRRAAYLGESMHLRFFLKKLNIDEINAQDNNPEKKRTALHWAVLSGSQDCVRALLSAGANPSIKDASDKMAKDYAKEDHKGIVSILDFNVMVQDKIASALEECPALIIHARSEEHLHRIISEFIKFKNNEDTGHPKLRDEFSVELLPSSYNEPFFYRNHFLQDLQEGVIPTEWPIFRVSFKGWSLDSIARCFYATNLNIQTGVAIGPCNKQSESSLAGDSVDIPYEYYLSRNLPVNLPTTDMHRRIVDAYRSKASLTDSMQRFGFQSQSGGNSTNPSDRRAPNPWGPSRLGFGGSFGTAGEGAKPDNVQTPAQRRAAIAEQKRVKEEAMHSFGSVPRVPFTGFADPLHGTNSVLSGPAMPHSFGGYSGHSTAATSRPQFFGGASASPNAWAHNVQPTGRRAPNSAEPSQPGFGSSFGRPFRPGQRGPFF